MYKRVEAQIVLAGMSKKELAKQLGMGYNTLNSKLNGKTTFSLDEASKIKLILNSDEPLEKLFDISA